MGTLEVGTPQTLLPELARIPGHVIWRAAARVQAALDDSLPPGVDIHGYAALLALAAGQARSQQWLADTVAVSRTTMTRVATGLVDRGLVERVRNPDDRRSYVLTRTPQGAATARLWRRHAEDVEESLSTGFTSTEREELRGLLLEVVAPDLAPGTPDALRESIGFLVTRLHARLHTEGMAAVREMGLEPRFMGSLVVLRRLGPISQAELARHLGVSDPSAVEIVDGLESRGLVERRRLPSDRRTQTLHLLPDATPVGDEAKTRLLAVTDRYLAALSQPERERFMELLPRFVTGG